MCCRLNSLFYRFSKCGEQTRGYWQVFANLAYRIDPKQPLESLKVGLARPHENYRFPSDEEFRKALEERDIYGKRICFDLLDRLEIHANQEPTDTTNLSIEHIMPQNEKLSLDWRKILGGRLARSAADMDSSAWQSDTDWIQQHLFRPVLRGKEKHRRGILGQRSPLEPLCTRTVGLDRQTNG